MFSAGHLVLVWVYYEQWQYVAFFACAGMLLTIMMRWTDAVEKLFRQLLLDKKMFFLDWLPAILIMPVAVFFAMQNGWNVVAGITALYWVSGVEALMKLRKWKKAQD